MNPCCEYAGISLYIVMPGFIPGIHAVTYRACWHINGMDPRNKYSGDEVTNVIPNTRVIPAKAGIQKQPLNMPLAQNWIPAFAGMTI